ncbi:hypothetical protein BU24DRAFT_192974 [Aaosphaeria arxii CBS 175.79]|uniref:DUF3074 domain-containing protein n=1 Tax=Aaosphaeria arxii CBS 175.79 TaxID=1450172 RepID=A0A6A5XRX9_9PLEO|nr:uncharacterized protein BU24DRAFT_192974 [Aaosphaeria arxii CBS 175.79]KAF2016075.1 hypothetical protein BU24DRAFT_192974 [Aaosphaeria arxii CBS 175.79]
MDAHGRAGGGGVGGGGAESGETKTKGADVSPSRSGSLPADTKESGRDSKGGGSQGDQSVSQEPAPAPMPPTPTDSAAGLRKRYLQLKPLGPYELPFHTDFGSEANRHPDLLPFIKRIFNEAKSLDISSWRKSSSHTFGPKSAAKGIKVDQLASLDGGEAWFARHSRHPEDEGTADGTKTITWKNFDQVLRQDHSTNEAEYTPNVYDCTELLRWNEKELKEIGKKIGFNETAMWIINMYHGIPWPLNDRVFSVLVLVGVRADLVAGEQGVPTDESIVVQLPVDVVQLPDIIKNRSHHRVPGTPTYLRDSSLASDKQKEKIGKKLVYGQYVSVERVAREIETDGKAVTHWTMATWSDAKGVLPGFVQKKALPGEIVKDIEYVYDFVGTKRREGRFD